MAKKYFKITNWKGHKNFECLYCKFATLDRRAITKHVDIHVRADLAAKEAEAESAPGDENYGLDVDPKSKKEKKAAKKETKKEKVTNG